MTGEVTRTSRSCLKTERDTNKDLREHLLHYLNDPVLTLQTFPLRQGQSVALLKKAACCTTGKWERRSYGKDTWTRTNAVDGVLSEEVQLQESEITLPVLTQIWAVKQNGKWISWFDKSGSVGANLKAEPADDWEEIKVSLPHDSATRNLYLLNKLGSEKQLEQVFLEGELCENGWWRQRYRDGKINYDDYFALCS
jgi:hypothetical protein